MSDKAENTGVENQVEDTGSESTVDVTELQAQLERLHGEIAKERNIRKQLQQERDSWKKTRTEDTSENFKELYQKQSEELGALRNKIKTGNIEGAVRSQLLKNGVLPEAVEAAVKLVDHKLISYDEESGVDTFGVETAVKKLKSEMKFMFETPVQASKSRLAKDGSGADSKTMTRAEFARLPIHEQAKAAKVYTIID